MSAVALPGGHESRIEVESIAVDGIQTSLRRVPGEGSPTVFVHGVPISSADWIPFLERIAGPAIAFDLPGFGTSERQAPLFPATMESYVGFTRRLLDELGVGEYSLVVHDWGGIGLSPPLPSPSDCAGWSESTSPLSCRAIAGTASPGCGGRRDSRARKPSLAPPAARPRPPRVPRRLERAPPEFVDMIWESLDAGTLDAILRLYRSAPDGKLAEAGRGLDRITAPALIVWGMKDRYIPGRFGGELAASLANAELVELPDAGHWPWVEQPEVVDRVLEFLEA